MAGMCVHLNTDQLNPWVEISVVIRSSYGFNSKFYVQL